MNRKRMDCGDNSCEFEGRDQGGMRTNAGCRCLVDIGADKCMRARGYIKYLESEVERLQRQGRMAEMEIDRRNLLLAKDHQRKLQLEKELVRYRDLECSGMSVTPHPDPHSQFCEYGVKGSK